MRIELAEPLAEPRRAGQERRSRRPGCSPPGRASASRTGRRTHRGGEGVDVDPPGDVTSRTWSRRYGGPRGPRGCAGSRGARGGPTARGPARGPTRGPARRASLPRSEASSTSSTATISSKRPGAWKPHTSSPPGRRRTSTPSCCGSATAPARAPSARARSRRAGRSGAARRPPGPALISSCRSYGIPARARRDGRRAARRGRARARSPRWRAPRHRRAWPCRPRRGRDRRHGARDEDDIAVEACDAVAAVGERVDGSSSSYSAGGTARGGGPACTPRG